MMDFFFFVKTFILTVAIVLVMQIQVGDRSFESHAMGLGAEFGDRFTSAWGGEGRREGRTRAQSHRSRSHSQERQQKQKGRFPHTERIFLSLE